MKVEKGGTSRAGLMRPVVAWSLSDLLRLRGSGNDNGARKGLWKEGSGLDGGEAVWEGFTGCVGPGTRWVVCV